MKYITYYILFIYIYTFTNIHVSIFYNILIQKLFKYSYYFLTQYFRFTIIY